MNQLTVTVMILMLCIDTSSGAVVMLNSTIIGLYLPLGVKRPGREADHSPPSSAEVNEWSYTSTPPVRLHGLVLS
jgi:hypothetical protein